jgi:hypothetical protein
VRVYMCVCVCVDNGIVFTWSHMLMIKYSYTRIHVHTHTRTHAYTYTFIHISILWPYLCFCTIAAFARLISSLSCSTPRTTRYTHHVYMCGWPYMSAQMPYSTRVCLHMHRQTKWHNYQYILTHILSHTHLCVNLPISLCLMSFWSWALHASTCVCVCVHVCVCVCVCVHVNMVWKACVSLNCIE